MRGKLLELGVLLRNHGYPHLWDIGYAIDYVAEFGSNADVDEIFNLLSAFGGVAS